MMLPNYVVIPTYDRVPDLVSLVESLATEDCNRVIIIDNNPKQEISRKLFNIPQNLKTTIIHIEEQPPNLSRLWNIGLKIAREDAAYQGLGEWNVAILNDDAVIPTNWYSYVRESLRQDSRLVAACTDPLNRLSAPLVKIKPDNDIMTRLCGWAFMLKGEIGLEFNESIRWWWGDTDFDWNARLLGGVLILPDYPVGNTKANSTTVGILAEQAGIDRQTFINIWGHAPW